MRPFLLDDTRAPRRAWRAIALTLFVGASVTLAGAPAVALLTDCNSVSMTVTVSGPNAGVYTYTVTGCWDVGQTALSHNDVLLMLGDCPCICDPGLFSFPDPAGTSTGEDETGAACTVNYIGEFLCAGDPAIPPELQMPAVKFEPAAGQTCQPTTSGCGTWTFYSLLAPGPDVVHSDAFVIKHGGDACTGDVSGPLPECNCPTAVEQSSWGNVKGLYR